MNGTMMQYFEWYLPADAQQWKRAKAAAPQLAKAGFTAVWLPPAYKGAAGKDDVGYGVYDMYDLGEFDQKGTVPTKYGTKAEYLAAIKALQKNGICVLADVVLNHRMGADGTDEVGAREDSEANRNNAVSGEERIRAYTRFTFPGRKGKYSDFCWDAGCFDGVDWDDAAHKKAVYLLDGKQWDGEVDKENGNYDYLMGADLDLGNPAVLAELDRWGKWYLETTGADGVRMDAVKHMRFGFAGEWLGRLRATLGREVFAVGEYWHRDTGHLLHYLDVCGAQMSLFDVPLHFKFCAAAGAGGGYDMRKLLADTLVSARPASAVTFVDNHDTQPGQALQSWIPTWFKPLAYAVILLREAGYPCVFYGDWYGIPHDGISPVAQLPDLVKLRQRRAYGTQRDYFDTPDVIGWTREGDAAHAHSGLAVLLSDSTGGTKWMEVGKSHAGETMCPLTGGGEPVVINSDGWGEFGVEGGSVRVYALAWQPGE